jgi:diguanylate cyclase (GGDEF)-like protein
VSAALATHAARALPRRGTRVAIAFPAVAATLVWIWAARAGWQLETGLPVVAVLLAAAAAAGRLVVPLGSRLDYAPATPVVLLAGLLGGPLAGVAAGGVVGLAQSGTPWRLRAAKGGLTATIGFAAGVAGLLPGSGPRHAIGVSLLAYAGLLVVGASGRAVAALDDARSVRRTVARATAADLLEWVVFSPLLGALVFAAESGGDVLVVCAIASLVVGLAVVLRVGRGRQAELEVERSRARTDTLTGAPNRRAFEEALAKEHARVLRGAAPAGLLLLDLDRFKALNDRYGHDAGDEALVEVVRRLREQLRTTDLVSRWGGEEFVVLAPAVGGLAELEHYAGRLRTIVGATPVALRRTAVVLTVSIGATLLDGSATPQQALERADRALYDAKRTRDAAVVALPLGAAGRRVVGF